MPALDRAKTIQAAERFVKAGKVMEAVKEYQKLADDNPRDMNVVNKLGDLLVRAGRNGEALKHFVRIADFYARDGFFLKAIAMYKKVTKLDPSNVEGQQRLAAMYAQQGLASDAKAQYVLLADQLVRQNQVPAAADALRRVLEIEPENPKARQTLADLLGKGGKADEAAREFCHLARAAAARGDIAAAVDAVRRGVDANPALPGLAALLLSIVVRLQAAPPPLVAAVEKMARQAGRSAMALLVLAETLRRSGKASEADDAFRRLGAGLDSDDDLNSEALVQLARHHDTHSRPDEAWDALDRAITRADQGAGPAPATMLDDFLARHSDHRQALARRAEIAARAGDAAAEVAALRRMAPLHAAAGERDKAEAAVERIATLLPGDPLVAALRDELAGRRAPAPSAPPAPAPAPTHAVAPAPAGEEDEIELELVETDDAGEAGSAAAEAESAEAVFNLDEDATVPEVEVVTDDIPPRATAPAPPDAPAGSGIPAAGPASEDEAYGTGSRIQEIQGADAAGRPIDEEFISEHLTEAEVFVKYGLNGKAREQLQSILERYPDHEAARVRLKDILVSEGNTEGAIRECLAIAEIMRQRGGEAGSRELINEAVRLDPESPLVARHRGAVDLRAAKAAPAGGKKKPAAAAPQAAAPRDPLALEEPAADHPKAVAAPKAAAKGSDEWLSDDKGIEIEVADDDVEESHDVGATTARTILPVRGERVEEEIPDELPRSTGPRSKAAKAGAKGETRGARTGGQPADLPETEAEDSLADMISGLDESVPAPDLLAPGARDPDGEKLGEVDFYFEQGLTEEARQVLFQLRKQYPGSAAVASRLERLDRPEEPQNPVSSDAGAEDLDFEVEQALAGKTAHVKPQSKPAAKPAPKAASRPAAAAPRAAPAKPVFKMEKHEDSGDGDFVDLAAELTRTLAEDTAAEPAVSETLDGQAHSFEDIFAAFKKGVEQQVDSDDFETHYNLGIAYKEMGLMDEAIGELQFAARDPSRTLECCGILGLCFRDKGMPDLALKWYKRGLDMPGLDEGQSLGLRYDMAEVYREKGEFGEALRAYTDVFGVDSTYRDVTARIKEMKGHMKSSRG